MPASLIVFTRDLRLADHPALHAAASSDHVIPLFVFDDQILQGGFNRPNRTAFLLESLQDLDASLRAIGSGLVVRRGAWVEEIMLVAREHGVTNIHISRDTTAFAQRRVQRLRQACESARITLVEHDGINVVDPGALQPSTGGDHFKVFTPYFRVWSTVARRRPIAPPKRLRLPDGVACGELPLLEALVDGTTSPNRLTGGESNARARVKAWTASDLAHYADIHDDLPGARTSQLSPYLHFGCISPNELAYKLVEHDGAEPFVRQLCWRDFYQQVLAARPDASWSDYKARGDSWNDDSDALQAWKDGRTGFPVVDAGMRQLQAEGFMHNRTRMIVASFLTKDLYIDWRAGAQHFLDWLIDGDIACNNLNWQWTAGTGTDTNPHRIFNPTVQGQRFDPTGEYVRRYVPELRAVAGKAIHEPWLLPSAVRDVLDYPAPIVDHHEAIAEYRLRQKNPSQ